MPKPAGPATKRQICRMGSQLRAMLCQMLSNTLLSSRHSGEGPKMPRSTHPGLSRSELHMNHSAAVFVASTSVTPKLSTATHAGLDCWQKMRCVKSWLEKPESTTALQSPRLEMWLRMAWNHQRMIPLTIKAIIFAAVLKPYIEITGNLQESWFRSLKVGRSGAGF